MSTQEKLEHANKVYMFMLVAGIITISFNLRPAITAVGPLLGMIRDDVGLTNWSAGLLTSLPLIAFAIMSPFAARIGNRYTYEGAMLIGLVLLLIGISARTTSIIILLFTGTLFAGLGIAILNVLLPGLIKDKFPHKVGVLTGIYTTTMGVIAAISSGISIPIAENLGLGWQVALLIWAIPVLLAILIWIYLRTKHKKTKTSDESEMKYVYATHKKIWLSPLAWQIAGFMGVQSFLFYVTISWLPEILHATGMTTEMAGWMLSFTQFIGLPASFLVPILAEKVKSLKGMVAFLTLSCFVGYGGLLISSHFIITVICIVLIGISLSGNFAFALTLFSLRTRTSNAAAELSGMAQTAGYVLAAFGPIFIGFLYDLSGSWMIPTIAIMIAAVIITIFGFLVSKEGYVYE
ncbi:MFS transporter [Oceanobacillus luteolus]|uniref:CynX/NimT family MFS transporter n=1 Tax=Oceanobacillus luteolus TaxID=1274358 RepID=A0ABW4HQA8_9BACI|nr:MFS transporter [Oceanobacillus luteolus]MCM3739834.1 MFS transporter [Oceanobacillus luteolus]